MAFTAPSADAIGRGEQRGMIVVLTHYTLHHSFLSSLQRIPIGAHADTSFSPTVDTHHTPSLHITHAPNHATIRFLLSSRRLFSIAHQPTVTLPNFICLTHCSLLYGSPGLLCTRLPSIFAIYIGPCSPARSLPCRHCELLSLLCPLRPRNNSRFLAKTYSTPLSSHLASTAPTTATCTPTPLVRFQMAF